MALDDAVAGEFRALLGDDFVLTEPEQLRVYDCDGLTGWRAQPAIVVLPGSTEEVQAARPPLRTGARSRSSRAGPAPASRAARSPSRTASSSRSRG